MLDLVLVLGMSWVGAWGWVIFFWVDRPGGRGAKVRRFCSARNCYHACRSCEYSRVMLVAGFGVLKMTFLASRLMSWPRLSAILLILNHCTN